MKKLDKITFVLLIVFAVVLGLTVTSLAEEPIPVITPNSNGVISTSSSAENKNNTTNNNTNNNVNNTNKNVNNTTNNTTNSNATSSYNNTNLPKTGIESYSPLFIIIGTLGVISIVAYRKADYYKNI